MPQKHSKNRGDTHHFTYSEIQEAGHGTQRLRFGADSQQPFGNCYLCLQRVRDPMASPSGHLYCKECIFQYLMTRTKELKRQRRRYEAQQEEFAARAREEAAAARDAADTAFAAANGPGAALQLTAAPAAAAAPPAAANGGSTALVVAGRGPGEESGAGAAATDGRAAAVARLAAKRVDASVEVRREELRRTSYWLPTFQPSAGEEVLPEPPKRPGSPITGRPLRLKELVPVNLTYDAPPGGGGGGGGGGEKEKGGGAGEEEEKDVGAAAPRGNLICAVSRKQIVAQPVVYLKKTGVLMLEQVAKKMVYPEMRCPETGAPFRMRDVLPLRVAGTSFAASGAVEAAVYRPTMR